MALTVSRSRGKRTSALARKSRASRTPTTESYSAVRKAGFLLNNATTLAEYRVAREEVTTLGIDPDSVPHRPPESR